VRVLKTVEALTCFLRQSPEGGQAFPQVGLVPTMGGLHGGHLSLIQRARQENDLVVVSLFLNPLQFGPEEDLDRYPQTQAADIYLCEEAGVDAVFMPTPAVLYGTPAPNPAQLTQVIPPPAMLAVLCGPFRPGHFEGVATVVTKLLSLVAPDRAYFGEKDAQQLALVKRLVKDLNLPGQVVGCPIVRGCQGSCPELSQSVSQ
jgi:pantoate ligase/cytidylate kinase